MKTTYFVGFSKTRADFFRQGLFWWVCKKYRDTHFPCVSQSTAAAKLAKVELRLRADSPAIDMGNSDLLPADEFDLDADGNTTEPILWDLGGNQRVQGTSVDIGAFEYGPMVGRFVFYAGTAFGEDVASDKRALLPGQPASFENYTSYDKGINGIMVDIAGLANPDDLNIDNLSDYFEFHVGNDSETNDWTITSAPTNVTVRPGEGVGDSDRVTLIWDDGVIVNQWLMVIVLPTLNTGLAAPDVFCFGSAPGESGNVAIDAKVNAIDMLMARNNPHNYQSRMALLTVFSVEPRLTRCVIFRRNASVGHWR